MNKILKRITIALYSGSMVFSNAIGCEDILESGIGTFDWDGVQHIIPNGSPVLFGDRGTIGGVVNRAQEGNDIDNPHGITHCGIAFWTIPSWMFAGISVAMDTLGTELHENQRAGSRMLYDIRNCFPEVGGVLTDDAPKDYSIFCAESDGSAAEVISGIWPHVHIHPLEQTVERYNGDVYYRLLNLPIPIEPLQDLILSHLGQKYESIFGIFSMFRAVRGGNSTQETKRVFCSELVALLFQQLDLIPMAVNVSNVVPEQLSFEAGEGYDILRGIAGRDIQIKSYNSNRGCILL
jgi:hypothetical protein